MARVEEIDEIKKRLAGAAGQNINIPPDYNMWQQIKDDIEKAGVESTGSYDGDKRLHAQLKTEAQNAANEVQVAQNQAQQNVQEKQTEGIAKDDSNQQIKSTMANAVSSTIMADYMKYYHLLV